MTEGMIQAVTLALVALGGNLPSSSGPPDATLRYALQEIAKIPELSLTAASRFWQSPAWPPGSGPDYINAVVAVQTRLQPDDLLTALHRIEAGLGRRRDGGRWQARGIDLDLIAWGDAVRPDAASQDAWRNLSAQKQGEVAPDRLILPHPRMQDRGFVLGPLAEIAPGWRHPRLGRTAAQLLADLPALALSDMKPISA